MMKNLVLGMVVVALTVAVGLFIADAIVDYLEYQAVLEVSEAIINL